MALNIPLPKVVADVDDSPLPIGMKGVNALEKGRLTNKFLPLDTAIKAQNSLAYTGKMGGIGTFLRGIAQLPVKERQAYLADPTNRANYMQMLETYRQAGGESGGGNSILTPDYVRSFGIGGEGGGGGLNPMSQRPAQAPTTNPIVNTSEQAPGNEEYDSSYDSAQEEKLPEEPNQGQQPKQGQPSQETEQAAPEPNLLPTVKPLTPQERSNLSAQMRTNNDAVGQIMKGRADASIALESWLQKARPQIAKMMKDAVKYNGIYGRSKNWMEKFKKDQPEEYANYIALKNSIIPLLANGVRFVEHMGVSHEAQMEANQLVAQVGKLDVSPQTALKTFNKTIRSLYDLSEGVLNAAEPAYPGARRKLANVPHLKGDYIPQTSIGNDEWIVYNPSGKAIGIGTTEQSDKLLKDHKGYYRKKQ